MKIKSSVFTHTHSKMQKHGKQPDNVWQKNIAKENLLLYQVQQEVLFMKLSYHFPHPQT